MKLERFKEKNNKVIGVLLFTIICILLIGSVILYKTFASFEVNHNFNIINGTVQDMGDLEFAFYVDDKLVKNMNEIPKKDSNYSLDTSSSYCIDLLNNKQVSTVHFDYENWEVRLKNIEATKTKCYLYFKQIYQEEELNGAIPDLGNGRLVPVQILEEKPTEITIENIGDGSYGGKVVKADITTSWYNYEEKRWANAVILKDGIVDDFTPGSEIPQDAIESYFVWIPRYKYQLFNENPDQYTGVNEIGGIMDNQSLENITPNIKIIFETKEDGISSGSSVGSYLTHPAFTSFESNGMWVGKFETGSTLTSGFNVRNSEAVQIKPNVYSWRYIDVAHAFYTSYDYLRELESHMMKNSEWGAISYLASSQYGLCDGNSCKDIVFNNNKNYITGYSSKNEPTCGWTSTDEECNKSEGTKLSENGDFTYNYFDTRSKTASTTGNYTGVYDMSGGAWDFVMGVMQVSEENSSPASGVDASSNSGFNGYYTKESETKIDGLPWPSKKYYDLYEFSTSTYQYQRGKLGDATKEFGPFSRVLYYRISSGEYGPARIISSYNADSAFFVFSSAPWFVRGGSEHYGAESGIMHFAYANGQEAFCYGFRIILTL